MTITDFTNQQEAEAAFRSATAEAWGTGRTVSMKVTKACGSPAGWRVVVRPRAIIGPDVTCMACGMTSHRFGCPAR